jgi:hypothetical protein
VVTCGVALALRLSILRLASDPTPAVVQFILLIVPVFRSAVQGKKSWWSGWVLRPLSLRGPMVAMSSSVLYLPLIPFLKSRRQLLPNRSSTRAATANKSRRCDDAVEWTLKAAQSVLDLPFQRDSSVSWLVVSSMTTL